MVTHKIDYHKIGSQIRIVRNQQHLSQEDLAELCDISPSFMGHIERGTRKMSIETLVSIADALHVSTDYILCSEMPNTDATITIIRALAKIADHL